MSMKTTEINIILLWYYFKKKYFNFKFFTSLCHAIDWTMRVIRLNSTRVSSQKFKFQNISIVSFGIKSRNFKFIWSLTGVDCNLLLKFLPYSNYFCGFLYEFGIRKRFLMLIWMQYFTQICTFRRACTYDLLKIILVFFC